VTPRRRSGLGPSWRRPRRGAAGRAALAALLLLTIAPLGCTPLYLPPVPSELPPIEPRLRLREVRIDRLAAGRPSLVLVPREVPRPGWLAVQWYPPVGASVAEGSVWLDARRVDRVVRLPFPDDVPRERPGRWRAVLTFDGGVLRQVEWEEPAGP
jgi:hypothetical protein